MGHLAVLDETDVTLDTALAALDGGEFETARQLIGQMKRKPGSITDFGGYLFVLGAAKALQADQEWSEQRRRATYLVAARYLQKSRELGVPPGRESQLMTLLGQSLIQANQPQQGIEVLNESLINTAQPSARLHQLLSEAYLNLPNPDLHAALQHNEALMADDTLDQNARTAAHLRQVDILIRLAEPEQAKRSLADLEDTEDLRAIRTLLLGRIAMAEATAAALDSPQKAELLQTAIAQLREAQRLDVLNGQTTRQAMYLLGKCLELKNETSAAIAEYEHIGNSYGDTPESIVATLSKARLLQNSGQPDKALAAFRAVVESVGDPVTYANPLVPMVQLRKELRHAHATYVENHRFTEALALIDHLSSLMGPTEVAELRAITHRAWGEANMEESLDSGRHRSTAALQSEGRYHFRAAGKAYETLAELRSASRKHTDDLWNAAENYYRGHSYSHAAQVLDQYLQKEARHRRALALLRYGESQLAVGQTADAISALQECIEMHPRDANIFAARVECAKAYLVDNKPEAAEALLRANLTGDTLRPESPEWRDSLFLLGSQLHETGRYEDAIKSLQEAVTRYPNAPQALLARYTIARSYHAAAERPAEQAVKAKTENERQKNRKLRDQNLESALQQYMDVQRLITLEGRTEESELTKALLRNCYMMQGSVLFQLRRYEDARKAYANVSTLYQHEPFVLESFVHIANCWHRLNQSMNARQTIAQAKLVLERLPHNLDFKDSTNFSRQQWELLLDEMARW